MTPITPRLSVDGPDNDGDYAITVKPPSWDKDGDAYETFLVPAEAAALLQALQPATGPVEGDIAKPCNCTVHIHCPRCKGADGIYPIGDDRMSCLECSHEWAAPSSGSALDTLNAQQGVDPTFDLRTLAGGFPADEDVDAFLQAASTGQAAPTPASVDLFVKCPTCGGSGYILDGDDTEDNCPTCGTGGYVPFPVPSVPPANVVGEEQ